MKETPVKHPEFDPEPYNDPILEECYRIKEKDERTIQNSGGIICVYKSRRIGCHRLRFSAVRWYPLRARLCGDNPVDYSFHPS